MHNPIIRWYKICVKFFLLTTININSRLCLARKIFDLHNWKLFIIDQIFEWEEIQYPIKEDQIGNVMGFPGRSKAIMQNVNSILAAHKKFWNQNEFNFLIHGTHQGHRRRKKWLEVPKMHWPSSLTKIHQRLSHTTGIAWEKYLGTLGELPLPPSLLRPIICLITEPSPHAFYFLCEKSHNLLQFLYLAKWYTPSWEAGENEVFK